MKQEKDASGKNGEQENLQEPCAPVEVPEPGFSAKSLAVALVLLCIAGAGIYFLLKWNSDSTSMSTTYNLKEFEKTRPEIILFDELKPIPAGFKRASCTAIGPDGLIYAGGDTQVSVFDMEGRKLWQIDLQIRPTCIAVADNKDIFVGSSSQVSVFNKEGADTRTWKFEKGSIITGISLAGKKVFIADAGKKMVHVKDLDSPEKEEHKIGVASKETGDDGIVVYSPFLDVTASDNDLVFVTDPGRHRVKLYSYSGGLVSTWKSNPTPAIEGFSGCCNPTYIALRPDGSIVTSEKAIPRIKLYSSTGEFIGVVAPPESFSDSQSPCDVAVDRNGGVYVMDSAKGNIRIFVEKQKVK
ncbi:MAG TPA: hypothetical protein DET40_01675 [Lentisphaeria bacterium]|nr:MAG: hypothetical protein A2X45_17045 [Lentisphaerae bacterium GWF2_50_93]HCE42242.1 hypothetical protein [Lentisphaeria bacterium]